MERGLGQAAQRGKTGRAPAGPQTQTLAPGRGARAP
jgi:hypothetical protein